MDGADDLLEQAYSEQAKADALVEKIEALALQAASAELGVIRLGERLDMGEWGDMARRSATTSADAARKAHADAKAIVEKIIQAL